jgi:hypothetical protein
MRCSKCGCRSYRRNALTRPSVKAFSDYKLFVALATLGKQKDADYVIRNARANIQKVARYLRQTLPLTPKLLYRGLLIQPDKVTERRISGTFEGAEYISFSEDIDVACYFASPDAYIAETRMTEIPGAVGWIAEYMPELTDILFHYSWAEYLNTKAPGPSIYQIYFNLEGTTEETKQEVTQIYWNLKTQKEVMCRTGIPLEVAEMEGYNCPDAQTLDNRFIPRPDFVLAPPGLESLRIKAGDRINIIRAEFPRPHTQCPRCGASGINTIYHLEPGLQLYKCSICKQNLFALQRNPSDPTDIEYFKWFLKLAKQGKIRLLDGSYAEREMRAGHKVYAVIIDPLHSIKPFFEAN